MNAERATVACSKFGGPQVVGYGVTYTVASHGPRAGTVVVTRAADGRLVTLRRIDPFSRYGATKPKGVAL